LLVVDPETVISERLVFGVGVDQAEVDVIPATGLARITPITAGEAAA
jgi:hypothetical protein